MKFGASLMGVRLRSYRDAVARIEEAGFESVWVPEHLAFPDQMPATYPYTATGLPPVPVGTPCYDPFAVLAYLACATSSIRLATNVCILPLHHPLETARSVVTVDRLSGGRITLGVGVGWLRQEFDWVGECFTDRGRRTDEIIEVLRRLWRDDVIEHESAFYRFGPLRFEPKPLQRGGIPIEVGGASPAALRRAAVLGDGWIEIGGESLDDLVEPLHVIRKLRSEHGGLDEPFEVTAGGRWTTSLDEVRRARDLGVTRVFVGPFGGSPLDADGVHDWARRFRDQIIEPLVADS
jgi:probable F420-dependent oxidoreductase